MCSSSGAAASTPLSCDTRSTRLRPCSSEGGISNGAGAGGAGPGGASTSMGCAASPAEPAGAAAWGAGAGAAPMPPRQSGSGASGSGAGGCCEGGCGAGGGAGRAGSSCGVCSRGNPASASPPEGYGLYTTGLDGSDPLQVALAKFLQRYAAQAIVRCLHRSDAPLVLFKPAQGDRKGRLCLLMCVASYSNQMPSAAVGTAAVGSSAKLWKGRPFKLSLHVPMALPAGRSFRVRADFALFGPTTRQLHAV